MDYQVRRNIENAVSCPRCLAGVGISCWTKGLPDFPHDERFEISYRNALRKLRERFLTHSIAASLINERLKRGFVRSSHPESTCLFIDTKAVTIDEEKYRKNFGADADALIEYAVLCKLPDIYIAKYSEHVQGIFDVQNEMKYSHTSNTKRQMERIADAASALNLDEAYEHCARMLWRARDNSKRNVAEYKLGVYA